MFIFPNSIQTQVILNGEDISSEIRTSEVNELVGKVATFYEIRNHVKEVQRKLSNQPGINGVIMDGRDIGTVIMPDAQIKIFLVASAEVRAVRRFEELKQTQSYESVLESIVSRDRQDAEREHSPLKKAPDAVEIDTSNTTIDEQVEIISKLIKERNF